jgi:uncharacterized protein (DUF2141 family)
LKNNNPFGYKMKTALLFLLFFPVTLFAQNARAIITISNVQTGKGVVVLNLYNCKENFFKKACLTRTVKADKPTLMFMIDVPEGNYAILVFQDLDEDGKLKLGWFNIPKEPVGFGNNFKPQLSKPKFADCAVSIKGTPTTFSIKLY